MSYITITSIMDFPVNWTTASLLHRFFLGGPMDGTVTQVFELPWQQPEVINVAKPWTIEELWSMAEGKDDPQPVTGTYRAAECPVTIKTSAGRKVVGVTYVWAGWDEADPSLSPTIKELKERRSVRDIAERAVAEVEAQSQGGSPS